MKSIFIGKLESSEIKRQATKYKSTIAINMAHKTDR